jgi:hypothetical protein
MTLMELPEAHRVKFNLRSYQTRKGSVPELCVEGTQFEPRPSR